MISGAHAILYSTDADADRAFLRDVLGLPHVDSGGGWLIFGLPPSEIAVHPAEKSSHEVYFLVDDVKAFLAEMKRRMVACTPVTTQSWGRLTTVTLPGGGTVGVYEPRHPRTPAPRARRASRATRTARPAKAARRRAP